MTTYLDFKQARCKNCYKCLRSCPVKAISVVSHQARIVDDMCILCGTCMNVCPQNAKNVHSEIDRVMNFLEHGEKVVASVAPSFVSSFGLDEFSLMRIALGKIGFAFAEETSVGANYVTKKYAELLKSGEYKNFITSACPAVNRLIQLYYPKALPYLAKVDSPMVAHAKMLKQRYPDARIVFIGPCVAKKREGEESGVVDAVLTFDDLSRMFDERNIVVNQIARIDDADCAHQPINLSKYYPISRGIIKSFEESRPSGYEYIAIDGVNKCMEVLANIDTLSGMFLELNACDYACVNGPCSLKEEGRAVEANAEIRRYVTKNDESADKIAKLNIVPVDIAATYPRLKNGNKPVTEREIREILAKTGKLCDEDELNCGACGYPTCRDKAIAVANGYAEVEMCLPYMRERAENMSYEIIQNSPNGIVVVDFDLKITEINKRARAMLGIRSVDPKGEIIVDYLNPTEFILAMEDDKKILRRRIRLDSGMYADLSISVLKEHKTMFAILTDITAEVNYDERLNKVRNDTIATTDEVIKKQMRVAQEIASLLGETTAETKVALLNLKKALSEAEKKGDND